MALKPSDSPPDVVVEQGPRYLGIHEFDQEFVWSPGSRRVAFVDCIFDWVETGEMSVGGNPIGNQTNRRCLLVAVSLSGDFESLPLRDISAASISGHHVSWIDNHQVEISFSTSGPANAPPPRILKVR